jgi:phospholipase/lecithinase/hemolysin
MISSHQGLNALRRLAVLACVFALTINASAKNTEKHKKTNTKPYTALYVFGDSYSDIGARYLDGNGPTAVAYFANAMGIPLTFPKDPKGGTAGLDFAATGATTGEDKGKGPFCCQGMMDQVNDFAARVHSGALAIKPETTLIFLEGGLNDKKLSTDATVENLTREIHLLQELGARHFTLSLLSTKIPDFAEIAKRLNPAYESLVAELQKQGVDIHLNHWGLYLDEIIDNPSQYGLVNTTSQCAGRAVLKEDPTPCANPDSYFYFHSGHPSAAVNKIVGDKIYRELTGQTSGSARVAVTSK